VESGFTGTNGQQSDGLVNPPQGRNIDGLTPDSSLGSDTGRVLSGSSVDDSVDEDLDRVLVGQKVDDLKRMSDDPDGQELLSVVPSVHHQRVDETLDNGHTTLGELLLGVSTGGVGNVDGMLNVDVVDQGDVLDFDVISVPPSKELDGTLLSDLLDIRRDGSNSSGHLPKLLLGFCFEGERETEGGDYL